MNQRFFEEPILNSPYDYPGRHWVLDGGQPTDAIVNGRRVSSFVTPIPKSNPRRARAKAKQTTFGFDRVDDFSDDVQQYAVSQRINEMRQEIERWRQLPQEKWGVTPPTARLLAHWRSYAFPGVRPFFCQVEAVETAIWLAEVAPRLRRGQDILDGLRDAGEEANPGLFRIALKLATGAGKTTVMAMLIAWQTVNAVRSPGSRFSKAFLLVAPGITIRDRLRVLLPNDPDNYYRTRDLVPADMLRDVMSAKVVITNYHAFLERSRGDIKPGTRSALSGWRGEAIETVETEGQMLQRAVGDLMGHKNIIVVNDEAHHCYREKPQPDGETEADLKGEERDEAKENNKAARLWIGGLEKIARRLGIRTVYDLSATPFFLRGSGYAEGTLFPWTVSDFSLMDAIECGIVKLPRVPISDNMAAKEVPVFRELWKHVGRELPKKGRRAGTELDPRHLPNLLISALKALYGHYEATFRDWEEKGIKVPPVFIVVCQNTAISKLVYDYVAGYEREMADGRIVPVPGEFELFRNFNPDSDLSEPRRTLLIDSKQLESGEAIDDTFREMAKDEIEAFRREQAERGAGGGDPSPEDLLREVMNTVGKVGRLGEGIRCVVSVSMLTEGWDANTVTHILGVRAFGTQLLCEQVVGRALRRESYELNDRGLFDPEYADILGIPFDFAAKPAVAKPAEKRESVRVYAVRPGRDAREITFPRVEGYRDELPEEQLVAHFSEDSALMLSPEKVGPAITTQSGIVGEQHELRIKHPEENRAGSILYHLARHIVLTRYRDANGEPKMAMFNKVKRIVREWLDGGYLRTTGQHEKGAVLYPMIMEEAAEKICAAMAASDGGQRTTKAVLDAYTPTGSTAFVNFSTTKATRWETRPDRCHVNWAICDSDWEVELCRVLESHPRVLAYVRNVGLQFEVPYRLGGVTRRYLPDFIVRIDDGHGPDDPLNLVIEVKGFRGDDAAAKAETMRAYWIPGVNNLGTFGRWAFAEFLGVYEMEADLEAFVDARLAEVVHSAPQPEEVT